MHPHPSIMGTEEIIINHAIQDHARWLQASPRTSQELLEVMDLPVAYPWAEDDSWVQRLSLALWDAGYTPHPADGWNPHWYWLEGASDRDANTTLRYSQ